MIFRKTGLWVIGLLVILFPVAAAADEGSTHGRWWESPAMAEKINLSPQERQTLDDLTEVVEMSRASRSAMK